MVSGLEWSEQYRLGIGAIDIQHESLFEIVARIASLDAATSTKEELKEILGELSTYMKEHFHDEEVYMKKIGFPDYDFHCRLHQEIIDFVTVSVTNSPTIAMIQTKLKFIIKKALIDHIISQDMKIKLYTATLRQEAIDECVYELA